jgi:hypothetical protein
MGDILEKVNSEVVNDFNWYQSLFYNFGPLILYLVVIILLSLYIKVKYNEKFNRKILLKDIFIPNKLKKYTLHISLLYSLIIAGGIFVFSHFNEIPKSYYSSWFFGNITKHFLIFISLLLGIWSLIVSYNVLRIQKSQIVSFEEFLSELRDSLYRLRIKATSKSDKNFYVYLYDYHPLIGNYSSPEKFKDYLKELRAIMPIENIHISFITYHQDYLASFFEKLSIDNDVSILSNSYDASNFIQNFEPDSTSSLLWKGKSIAQFHFIIIEDEAYQYVVLPERRGINKLFGVKSEDPFVVNYLQKSFVEKLSNIISPIDFECANGLYNIYFEPQSNVEKINIYYDFDNSKKDRKPDFILSSVDDFIHYDETDINGFKIKSFEIKKFPFSYELVKRNNIKSAESRLIHSRELDESIVNNHFVDYIHPDTLIPNKINSCLDKLKLITDNKIILKISVFYDSEFISLTDLSNSFNNVFTDEIPIIFIAQKPEYHLVLEVISVNKSSMYDVTYAESNNFRYTTLNYNGIKEFYFTSNMYESNNNLKENTKSVFENFGQLLDKLNAENNNIGLKKHIHRQWNYIDNITETFINDDNAKRDNYDIFCEIRKNFYEDWNLSNNDYPSATGVNIDFNNYFCLSAIAIISSENPNDVERINLESTKQINPYDYTDETKPGSKPYFKRGNIIQIKGNPNYMFISGTASIKGEKTYYEKNEKLLSQIKTTIDSIYHLINRKSEKTISLRNMDYIRIYYIDEKHLPIIKTFLNPLIHTIPHIYLKSKICRDDLYIEIETGRF